MQNMMNERSEDLWAGVCVAPLFYNNIHLSSHPIHGIKLSSVRTHEGNTEEENNGYVVFEWTIDESAAG
jgi:hypothetical protein